LGHCTSGENDTATVTLHTKNHLSVIRIALAGFFDNRMFKLDIKTFKVFLGDEVDNTRDGVRSIKRRGTVFHDFHTLQRNGGVPRLECPRLRLSYRRRTWQRCAFR
jgi:hypothetical protein